jgi:hypothetical protein
MYLLKVTMGTKTELNLIRDAFSRREGKEVTYDEVIQELLTAYKIHSKTIKI